MLSNAYETLQVILQKNTRVQKKVSLIFIYVFLLSYNSGFLNLVLPSSFPPVLSTKLWDKRLGS